MRVRGDLHLLGWPGLGSERRVKEQPRVDWERHGDILRTHLQEMGRVRLYFLTLRDLAAAVIDLGIDPADVIFRDGYAVVQDDPGPEEGE